MCVCVKISEVSDEKLSEEIIIRKRKGHFHKHFKRFVS